MLRRPARGGVPPWGEVGGDPAPSPQYYTCSCILAFVACSVFLRMSLELKVLLLTVALVAYLVLFHVSPCAQWGCCGRGLGHLSGTNTTLRWGPSRSSQDPGPLPTVTGAHGSTCPPGRTGVPTVPGSLGPSRVERGAGPVLN